MPAKRLGICKLPLFKHPKATVNGLMKKLSRCPFEETFGKATAVEKCLTLMAQFARVIINDNNGKLLDI